MLNTQTDSEWLSEANQNYVSDRGSLRPDLAWILSPYDVWYKNPYYIGPDQPHPESGEGPTPLSFDQAKKVSKLLAALHNKVVTITRDGEGFAVQM